jgi:hypothetical protein
MVRSVWHRTLLVLLGICVVALVGTLHEGAVAGAGTKVAAGAASVPECRNADLRADYRARDSAAGHRYGVVRLRNTSDHSCAVRGYGGLSYVGSDGTQVGAAADRELRPVRRVVLEPGERALSTVSETVASLYPASRCRPAPVDRFRVYVPDATRSQLVVHRTTGCRDDAVHLLSHTPYRAQR